MNPIVSRRSVGGVTKLALRFPAASLKGAGLAVNAAMAEEGYLVSTGAAAGLAAGDAAAGEGSAPWRFESLVPEGEEVFLVGPDSMGREGDDLDRGLDCLDDERGLDEGMSRILALARALNALEAEDRLPRGLVSTGILFSEGGDEVLVLPPSAAAKALAASGAQARAAARLSSPRSKGPEGDASFLLAQAAYRIASGKSAFPQAAEDRGSVAGAAPPSVPAALAAPGLVPELASLVDKALANPEGVGLGEWIAVLDAARGRGWTRAMGAEEEAELARRRSALEAGALKGQRRAAFFRRRGGIIVGVAAALLALAFIVGDMARAQRSKPDYSWLTARELVQRYYLAMDSLDLDSLEACGDAKAVKADRDYLVNLVVLTKTRIAYEGKSPVVRAVDWLAAGRLDLAPSDFLYGIAGLSISGGEGSPDYVGTEATNLSFRAEYSLWSLDRIDDPSGDPSKVRSAPAEEKRVDELGLTRGEKGWKITSLKRAASR